MNNLTQAQQREIFSKLSDMNFEEIAFSSKLQNLIGDYCFPKCIKKIKKRSDEVHTGEIYCIRRCVWRFMYTRNLVEDFYKNKPIPDYSKEIDSLELDLHKKYEEFNGDFSSWRQKAIISEQKRKERLNKLQLEKNEQEQIKESELIPESNNYDNSIIHNSESQADDTLPSRSNEDTFNELNSTDNYSQSKDFKQNHIFYNENEQFKHTVQSKSDSI